MAPIRHRRASLRGLRSLVSQGAHALLRTDGLLGMSFLARFEVRLTPNGLELTSPQSKDGQEIDQTASNTNAGRKGRSPR